MLKHVGFAGIAISSAMALVLTAGVDAATAKTKMLSYESAFAKISAQEIERREAAIVREPFPLPPTEFARGRLSPSRPHSFDRTAARCRRDLLVACRCMTVGTRVRCECTRAAPCIGVAAGRVLP